MTLTEQIAARCGVAVTRHGQMRLIPRRLAGVFVAACEARGIRILGLDAVKLLGEGLLPEFVALEDFGSVDAAASAVMARRALNALDPALHHFIEFHLAPPTQGGSACCSSCGPTKTAD